MNITQHTDYALRVLIYAGTNPDRLVTIKEVAERFAISRTHLMKVVTALVAGGYLDGVRGKGGGVRLARAAGTITVGEVVRYMERGFDLVECFRDEHLCLITPGCRLKGALHTALNAFLAALDAVLLTDLLAGQPQLPQLLGIPVVVKQAKPA